MKTIDDIKGTGFFQTIDQYPAPKPDLYLSGENRGNFISELIEALANTPQGFSSYQLEEIMPIVDKYIDIVCNGTRTS